MSTFEERRLPGGVPVFLHRTAKFKTTTIRVFLQSGIGQEPTVTALVPMLLRRGTQKFPTTQALARELEDLYGAEVRSDVVKMGDRQVGLYHLDMVNERYLPGSGPLHRRGLSLLGQVMQDPITEDGVFRADYVAQEKENLSRAIDGIRNEKIQYAQMRCIEETFPGDPYAIPRFGRAEEIPAITPGAIHHRFATLLREAPMEIYAVGDIDFDRFYGEIAEVFDNRRREQPLPPVQVARNSGKEPRVVVEEQDVQQGKLVMALSTGMAADNPRFPALVMASGVLGGFSHSKLFQNVREKASLAYYASARVDALKGIMVINAGIEFAHYEQTVAIIREQITHMQEGRIGPEEIENTRLALLNHMRSAEDSPSQQIMTAFELRMTGRSADLSERMARIRSVTRDDIVAAAREWHLETIYFLTAKGGAQHGAPS